MKESPAILLHLWCSCESLWAQEGSNSGNFVGVSRLLKGVAADIPLGQEGKDEHKNRFLAGFASIWDYHANKKSELPDLGSHLLNAVRLNGAPHTTPWCLPRELSPWVS